MRVLRTQSILSMHSRGCCGKIASFNPFYGGKARPAGATESKHLVRFYFTRLRLSLAVVISLLPDCKTSDGARLLPGTSHVAVHVFFYLLLILILSVGLTIGFCLLPLLLDSFEWAVGQTFTLRPLTYRRPNRRLGVEQHRQ